jgi:sugar phosphate isomerase/epimerase
MSEQNLRLSINQVTTRDQWDFAQAVNGYARHGVMGTTVWFDKLRAHGVSAGAKLLRDTGMTTTGLCVGGLLSDLDHSTARARVEENKRLIDDAVVVGAPCLVLIGGGLEPGQRDVVGARQRVLERVGELLPYASDAGVVLALEPLHPMVCAFRSVLCTLGQANDWCDALGGGPNIGIAVDTYNVWWDPDIEAQLERAQGRIAAYHVADWLLETSDLRTDRGMPGDGVIDLPRLRKLAQSAGYTGFQEVEILSTSWWARDPDEVVATIVERYAHTM